MKRLVVFIAIVFLCAKGYSQTIDRQAVDGVILSSTNSDLEAVTIYNTSSNTGTITDVNGAFKIKVAINDVIEISALQFQTVTVTIDTDIVASKVLKIQLVDDVNKLDAVTLSSGLSGNMAADISGVKTVKAITIDMGNINVGFEYNDDKAFDNSVIQNHLTSIINPNARQYKPDLFKIIKLITKSKKALKVKKDVFVGYKYEKPKDLFSVFTLKEIQEQFEISDKKIQEFIGFIEHNGIAQKLLESKNKMLFIEFLIHQKNQFLKHQDVKD
ncbi:carboxypeptidase-like regulatory domain-containing protein [uncultured Algibacter sp.]|uniref:carboxypeptidase-like regulatory domain-containing protein n=1 Tax=uncultured Algibacter sp. TaxID=298659 RepID=UPI003217A205